MSELSRNPGKAPPDNFAGSPNAEIHMINVGDKPITHRRARARASVQMQPQTLAAILGGQVPKGNVLASARLAGIMAAKRTWDFLPLCHPISLDGVQVNLHVNDSETIVIETEVEAHAKTGVEMEAMMAAAVAALTIYDMCKGMDRAMRITEICLLEKTGGRSGHFARQFADKESGNR